MLRAVRLPRSLLGLLEEFRPCFTARSFPTFALLAAGLIARPAGRTVCGMLAGAGLGGVWHHSRAHRFFAGARWSTDAVGLVVLRLVTGWLVPVGAPVVIAVDDTMFRRTGRKVYAACWGYDGSLKGGFGRRETVPRQYVRDRGGPSWSCRFCAGRWRCRWLPGCGAGAARRRRSWLVS